MVAGYQSLAEDQANMLKDSFGKAENASFTTFDVDQVHDLKVCIMMMSLFRISGALDLKEKGATVPREVEGDGGIQVQAILNL